MRIAIVTATPQNVEQGSGTFVATAHLNTELRSRGHTVDVFAPDRPSGPLGFTAHRFWWNWRLDPRQFDDHDVVVGFDMDGYAINGRVKPPFVAYLHGVIGDEATFEKGWVRRCLELMARAEKRSVHRADAVMASSRYSRSTVRRLYHYAGDISVVPPSVDIKSWDEAVASVHSSGRVRPTVLCVGVQYPRKNVATLIRATAILRRRIPDVEVRIASKGPEWDALRRLARSLDVERNVTFLGYVTYRQLIQEYVDCQVFCLPTLQEGFGIVFAEAMATGKPIVASRSSSTPELIDDGVQGLLAEPSDAEDLALKLAEILGNPAAAKAMGNAGRARIIEFDAPIAAQRFIEALESWGLRTA